MSIVRPFGRGSGMLLKSRALLCAALPLALAAGAGAQPAAQPAPGGPAALQPGAESVKYTLPAGGLSLEKLGEVLTNVGYEPETIQNNLGGAFYRIEAKRGAWTLNLNVSQSIDKKVLWISTALSEIPNADKASPAGLMKILAKNFDIAPAFFEVRNETWLYYALPVPNYDVKPATIRKAIDDVFTDVQQTQALWDAAKVNNTAPAAPPVEKP